MPLETLDLDKITTLEDALLVIRELVLEVVTLRAENTELRSENTRLKERIAKLEKNSSNSSKPPSSDITKPESEQRQVGKRKIGAQLGHKANFRRKFSAEEIDHREKLKPLANCPECRTKLEPTEEVQIYQQAELVDRPVVISEYQLPGSRCPCCKKTFYPELPLGVIQGQLLGPKVLSLFGYMKAAMGVSISELAEFSKDVLKLDICRGVIQKAIFRVSDALKPAYEELSAIIPEQQALNVDETGWKQNGSRHWVWIFCNTSIAFFVISKHRSCQVLEDVLGKNFLGTLTSDFYSAYVKYASPFQQYCLAHLIRELKFLTTLPDSVSKKFGIRLLAYMKRLFKLWHSRNSFTPEDWKKKTERLKRDLQRYVFSHSFEKKSDARRIQRRFIKHWASLFRFLDSPELYEPTNNLAERTLRHLVRLRRISFGSRGKNGSDWTQQAASIIATCKLQKKSAWEFFQHAVFAKACGGFAPSLISRA